MNTQDDEKIAYTFIVAGVVIKKEDKYLLVQEKLPKAYGLWNLPAGKVELGDSIEQTAIKEAKEESGFDVELLSQLGIYHEDVDKPVKHAFEAKITAGELKFPEDEILDAKWFTFRELQQMNADKELRGDWMLKAIEVIESR